MVCFSILSYNATIQRHNLFLEMYIFRTSKSIKTVENLHEMQVHAELGDAIQ